MSSKLQTRRLGKDGPEVTALGYGAMGLSLAYGAVLPEEQRLRLLDQIYELGETNWDSGEPQWSLLYRPFF
jgi:aryl-alcohol dehydrogenase-like predicted oxidoreductase